MHYLTEDILEQDRSPDSHKGDFGKVLVVAGSEDYAGAAVLTSTACEAILRSGADLAVACCPEKIAWLVNEKIPDVITKKFEGRYFVESQADEIIEMSEDYDLVLIGPGLGKNSRSFAKKIVENVSMPKVIDADAIHASNLKKVNNAVFTPHEKEFEELLENSGLTKDDYRERLADNVILLKGREDEIISKDRIVKNKTGNAVMTKGGTGDVLAGLTAGFIAQANSLFKAACMAAYLNGAVGDVLKKERGDTFIASDIVDNLHKVYG